MRARKQITVGTVESLPPGSVRIVSHGRAGIGVINVGGELYALSNSCPHRGAPLCLGEVTGTVVNGDEPQGMVVTGEGEFLECPWHGWRWKIATGTSDAFPDRRARTYPVHIEDGNVILSL